MNRKICRNEKHKYSNKEKLAFGEKENKRSNKYCPGEWQQYFWVVTKLVNIQSSLCHLKCSRFCLLLLFLFYFYCIPKCSCYCSFHGYKREEKSNLKANTPGFKNFQFFPTPPRTISFRCFFQPPLLFHPPSIRGLRVRYKGNHSPSYWKIECLWARCCIEKPQNFSKVTRKVIFKLCLSLRI